VSHYLEPHRNSVFPCPRGIQCLFNILGCDSGAIRCYDFAVKVRSMLPNDLLQLQRELRNVPLPCDVERQAASNHGLARIADPVRIPHGVDALDGLRSEVQKERLAGVFVDSESTQCELSLPCCHQSLVTPVKDLGFIGSWRQEQTIELTRARLI
jgi:hypothetical protein